MGPGAGSSSSRPSHPIPFHPDRGITHRRNDMSGCLQHCLPANPTAGRLAWISLALTASLLPSAAAAQDPKPEQPKFETGTEVVLVDVTVISGNGEPVTGLGKDDF